MVIIRVNININIRSSYIRILGWICLQNLTNGNRYDSMLQQFNSRVFYFISIEIVEFRNIRNNATFVALFFRSLSV